MITNVAAWVMQIIVCHHLLKKWWEKVEQSWQLSGWISTPLCVVVGISIEVSDHCNADSTIITFISGKPHLRDVVILSCVQPTDQHDDGRVLTFPELAASMSIILPGVQTMISAPRFNSAICSEIPVPPVLHNDDDDDDAQHRDTIISVPYERWDMAVNEVEQWNVGRIFRGCFWRQRELNLSQKGD